MYYLNEDMYTTFSLFGRYSIPVMLIHPVFFLLLVLFFLFYWRVPFDWIDWTYCHLLYWREMWQTHQIGLVIMLTINVTTNLFFVCWLLLVFRKVKKYRRFTGKYINGRMAGEKGKIRGKPRKNGWVDRFATIICGIYLTDWISGSVCLQMFSKS